VRLITQQGVVTLQVKDYGRGIDKQDLDLIFGRFERAISPNEVSGLGLGLFISKEIIMAHKGQIEVESELDKGSTFTVKLKDV
jgi:signal transduction histidine kinase